MYCIENAAVLRRITAIVLLALLIWSCQSEKRTSATSFVADPQPVPKQEVEPLAIGAEMPPFELINTDGTYYNSEELQGANAVVIVFTCNHCPTAQAYEQRLIDFTDDYRDKGVEVVAISPNSPLGLLYEELGYSDLDDDYEAMVLRDEHMKFNFPYLYDGDDHGVSLKFGPTATPHVFVFGPDLKLKYRGHIDGSEKPGSANAERLRTAVDAVLEGREIIRPDTKAFGCSTKWAWKTEYKDKVEADWKAQPVSIQMIDLDSLKTLLTNFSPKIRLVNFWATWCGPCKLEYPEFLKMQRMYGARNFEFVSISLDRAEKVDDALTFLKQVHSPVNNYLCTEEDKYKLIEAVNPDWDGSLPFTMILEPYGEVYASWHGAIDPLEVKRKIVEHRLMGRYY